MSDIAYNQIRTAMEIPLNSLKLKLVSFRNPDIIFPSQISLQENELLHQYISLKDYFKENFGLINPYKFQNWSEGIYSEIFLKQYGANFDFLSRVSAYRSLLVGLHSVFILNHRERQTQMQLKLSVFSGLDPLEFKTFTGLKIPEELLMKRNPNKKKKLHNSHTSSPTNTDAPTVTPIGINFPDSFDLRYFNAVTPIKYQGNCGSCWAFAATAVNEGRMVMVTKSPLISLSEQQLVSCSNENYGCFGGWVEYAWDYTSSYGQVSETELPYISGVTGKSGACPINLPSPVIRTESPTIYLTTADELKQALFSGPVAIAIASYNSCFISYHSGVLNCNCPYHSMRNLDHAVTVIGWEPGYWIIKNEWGTEWGIDGFGYFPMINYPGTCGMFVAANYPDNIVK